MSNKVVRYSNDLNKINLSSLKEQEQNLLFEILLRINDHGTAPMSFTVMQLKNMIFKNNTLSEVTSLVKSLKDHFFSLNFTQLLDDGEREVYRTMNLFSVMEIEIDKKTKNLKMLTLQVAEPFAYIINELTGNFTRFELAEFVMLQSKYSKTLFRLLKQYRTSGWAQFNWEDFLVLMGIPKSYQISDIEKRILKPVVKELNWDGGQADMFKDLSSHGVDHPAFRNLVYEKVRSKSGKGRKVIAIRFMFDPENALPPAQQPPKAATSEFSRRESSKAIEPQVEIIPKDKYVSEYSKFCDKFSEAELEEVLNSLTLDKLNEMFLDLQKANDLRYLLVTKAMELRVRKKDLNS